VTAISGVTIPTPNRHMEIASMTKLQCFLRPRPKMCSVHTQPGKTFYLAYQFTLLVFIKLPYWTCHDLSPRRRPSKSWSLRLSLTARFCRWWQSVGTISGLFTVFARDLSREVTDRELIKAGNECRFVWIPAIEPEKDIIEGTLVHEYMERNKVSAFNVPGYFWGERAEDGKAGQQASPNEKVVLHFHGGAYIVSPSFLVCSTRTSDES
jgi:hypothetical protein